MELDRARPAAAAQLARTEEAAGQGKAAEGKAKASLLSAGARLNEA